MNYKLLVGALSLALLSTEAAASPGDEIYARPGQLFRASDGAQLNFYCIGIGSPAVIFDSGFLDWAPAWSVVQPRIATFTRACSYDRAGAGFSGPAPMPVTVDSIATELDSALKAGGITGPYILVGAASGGNHIRAFADLFPQDVAGLVLLDADASDVDLPENRKDDDDGITGFVPRAMACRDAIAKGNADATLPPVPGRASRRCATIFFRGLPESSWSTELNTKLIDIGGHNVPMWDADISEARNIPAGEIWLQQHRRTLGSTPIRILSTGHHGIHDLTKPPPVSLEQLKYQYDRAVAQSRWLTLSSDANQIFVQNSSEYIAFEQPDAVVDAVRDVWAKSRR